MSVSAITPNNVWQEGRSEVAMGLPLHPFLWEITLPAVRSVWDAARAYIASGKYVPRSEPPRYRENESGWPATVGERLQFQTPPSAPIDWMKLISMEESKLSNVVVGDLPEVRRALNTVLEAAEQDEVFASGMNIFNHSDDEEFRSRQLINDYLGLIKVIIGRADSTGVESDEELLDLYLALERARFAPELTGDLIVPLTLLDCGTNDPVDLGNGVRIERIDPEFQCARAPAVSYSSVNPYLIAAATHAVVVSGVTLPNRPYAARLFAGVAHDGESLISRSDMDRVDTALQCIHIVTGGPAGYNQVLVRPDGWADGWVADLPPISIIETVSGYPDTSSRAAWNEPRETIDPKKVGEIVAAYSVLAAATNDVKLAARRSVRAMMRTNDEDRTLDATIGVEALLLEDNAELKYRMALRAAAALCDEYRPEVIFELARKVYDHRSKIAHGMVDTKPTFTYDGVVWSSAEIAPFLLRALLRSRLLSEMPWTKQTLEARILAALSSYETDKAEK